PSAQGWSRKCVTRLERDQERSSPVEPVLPFRSRLATNCDARSRIQPPIRGRSPASQLGGPSESTALDFSLPRSRFRPNDQRPPLPNRPEPGPLWACGRRLGLRQRRPRLDRIERPAIQTREYRWRATESELPAADRPDPFASTAHRRGTSATGTSSHRV